MAGFALGDGFGCEQEQPRERLLLFLGTRFGPSRGCLRLFAGWRTAGEGD